MDETIVFKNLKTKIKKWPVFIIVSAILFNVVCCLIWIQDGIYSYEEHIVYNKHYPGCYNEKGEEMYYEMLPQGDSAVTYSLLSEIDGVNVENCEYKQFKSAISCGISNIFDYRLFEVIVITIPCILIVVISICYICLTRCKFNVTENNIYGKKGSKKFDITFKDIVELTQKRKGIIIKTTDKRLKLSQLKNADEIYNYIKPFAPQKTIAQQVTSTVDDIKLF